MLVKCVVAFFEAVNVRLTTIPFCLLIHYFCPATRTDILQILEADPQLASFSLSNKALQDVHVLPLIRALQCHDTLTTLTLPGNRIGMYMW